MQATAESTQLSQAFFSNPENYGRLTHPFQQDCVEPRDEVGILPGDYPIVMQTPGGKVGAAMESALALTADSGELATLSDGMQADHAARLYMKSRAHYRCKFIGGIFTVMAEVAQPSNFTLETVARNAYLIGEPTTVERRRLGISNAAARGLEDKPGLQWAQSLRHHAEISPGDIPKPYHVLGKNIARVHVTSLHPDRGQNRNKKAQDPSIAARTQAYVDTLAADVWDLRRANVSREVRNQRLTAKLLISAATATVVSADHLQEFTFLEALWADNAHGLQIVEREVA